MNNTMSSQITFYGPTKFARLIQKLVGKYDGRFVNNPLHVGGGETHFKISFEDSHNFNQFCVRTEIIKQPFM